MKRNLKPPDRVISLGAVSTISFLRKIVQLGLTISDPKVRDESLATAIRHLAYTDDDRQAAIEALPVTKEEKEYLRHLSPRDEQH